MTSAPLLHSYKVGSMLINNELSSFQVVVKNDAPVGDVILDEALKHIKETATPETLQNWVDYLSGSYIHCPSSISDLLHLYPTSFSYPSITSLFHRGNVESSETALSVTKRS